MTIDKNNADFQDKHWWGGRILPAKSEQVSYKGKGIVYYDNPLSKAFMRLFKKTIKLDVIKNGEKVGSCYINRKSAKNFIGRQKQDIQDDEIKRGVKNLLNLSEVQPDQEQQVDIFRQKITEVVTRTVSDDNRSAERQPTLRSSEERSVEDDRDNRLTQKRESRREEEEVSEEKLPDRAEEGTPQKQLRQAVRELIS